MKILTILSSVWNPLYEGFGYPFHTAISLENAKKITRIKFKLSSALDQVNFQNCRISKWGSSLLVFT